MNITRHDTTGLIHHMTLVIPAQDVETAYHQELEGLNREAKIAGFRSGKIPTKILEQRYGQAAYDDAVNSALQHGLQQAQAEKKLKLANVRPKVTFKNKERGKDVIADIEFETLPTIEVGNLNSLQLTRLVLEPSKAELDEALKAFTEMEQLRNAKIVDRAATDGDGVVVQYELYIEDSKEPALKRPEFLLILGEDTPFFEATSQIKGLKAGDTVTLKTKFPKTEDYGKFAGKAAEFHVTVNQVRERPEIKMDDEFAQKFGAQDMKDFLEKYKESLVQHQYDQLWTQQKRLVLDVLAETYNFDIPPTMVENEFHGIWHRFLHDYHHQHGEHTHDDQGKCQLDLTKEEETKIQATYRKIAERRVRLGLLLSEISKLHKPAHNKRSFGDYLRSAAERLDPKTRQALEKELKNPTKEAPLLDYLRSQYFEDLVIDHLLDTGKTKEEKLTLADLHKRTEKAAEMFGE